MAVRLDFTPPLLHLGSNGGSVNIDLKLGPPGPSGPPGPPGPSGDVTTAQLEEAMGDHEAASDPHPQYLKAEDATARYAAQMNGTGKTLAELNAWLAVASPLGIKRLAGTVNLTGPLVLNTANTYLDVSGTTLNTTGDYAAITSLNAQAISIANCKIVNSFTGTRTTYDIDITNPTKPNLINVEINLTNTSTAMGGIRVRYDSGQAGNRFMPILDKVWVRNGHLVIDGVTDGRVTDSWIWAPYTGAVAAVQMINSANGWNFSGVDVVPTGNGGDGAGYYLNGCAHNTFTGGYVDGNDSGIMTGHGFKLVDCINITLNTRVWSCGRSALHATNCNGINGSLVASKNNKQDNFYPDVDLYGCNAVTLTTTHWAPDARTNKGAAIREDATSGANVLNKFKGTILTNTGNNYASPAAVVNDAASISRDSAPLSLWSYTTVNAQTANYAVQSKDLFYGRTIVASNAITVTLPNSSSVHGGDVVTVKNVGTAIVTVATTSSQVIDGGPTSVTLLPNQARTFMARGAAGWSIVGAVQVGPTSIVPPASLVSVPAATAWPAANTAIFHFFQVTAPTTLRYLNFRLDSASGNYQIALVRMDSATAYTRIADTGVIAQPAAGDKTIDLGATYLDPGEYAVVMWMDNTSATVRYASNSGMTASRLTASVASLASGVPASGTLTRGSTSYVGGMNLTAA